MDSAAGRKLIPRSDFAYALSKRSRCPALRHTSFRGTPSRGENSVATTLGAVKRGKGKRLPKWLRRTPDDFREAHRFADQDVAPARFRDQPRAQVALGDVAHVHDPEFDVGHAQAQAAVAEFAHELDALRA